MLRQGVYCNVEMRKERKQFFENRSRNRTSPGVEVLWK